MILDHENRCALYFLGEDKADTSTSGWNRSIVTAAAAAAATADNDDGHSGGDPHPPSVRARTTSTTPNRKQQQDLLDGQWNERFEQLVAHKRKYGTTYVPMDWSEDQGFSIWVKNQRSRCKQRDRIEKLNGIGFRWDLPLSVQSWFRRYILLFQHKEDWMKDRAAKVVNRKRKKPGDGGKDRWWKEALPNMVRWVRTEQVSCVVPERIELLAKLGIRVETNDNHKNNKNNHHRDGCGGGSGGMPVFVDN